jgi:hypothetical protein
MKAATAQAAREHTAPPPWIRVAVREVLQRAPAYERLDANKRRALARDMVRVSTLAADLIAEERDAEAEIAEAPQKTRRGASPLSRAQSQPAFGESANRIASTTRSVLNAVSFPRFVTDLINGVFKAMLSANAQQMQQYVELLNAVSTSAEGFERSQFSLAQVRRWVAERFPDSIEYETADPDWDPDPEEESSERLRLRSGATMPGEPEIRATLGIPPEASVDASNPEQLVPLARRFLARQRQQQLATMVMLGMQRIVIDAGRINASMRFHIDTRSAAAEDRASEFGLHNRVAASGQVGIGAWGASAEVENTISYVSTQRNQATEEMNTDLELNSSVELNFHTDYLPLNQMAAQAQADRIRNASLNPAAEPPDPAAARTARQTAQRQAEQQRRGALDNTLNAHRESRPAYRPPPTPPTPPNLREGGSNSGDGANSNEGANAGTERAAATNGAGGSDASNANATNDGTAANNAADSSISSTNASDSNASNANASSANTSNASAETNNAASANSSNAGS